MKKQYNVKLNDKERSQLKKMTEKGSEKGRKIKRAQILLLADKGKKDQEVAEWIDVTTGTVQRIRKRYATEGLERAIGEKSRSGRPVEIKAETRAKITALACTKAPAGRTRWTLRLLADKAVELEYTERISHQSVDNILKKTN
jgi:transposase